MSDLDTREWLLANGLGSFASGTVSDVRTRTYHGWLLAATSPPSGRVLLLSHLGASLETSEEVVALGTNFWGSGQIEPTGYEMLRSFEVNPVPKWIWGAKDWQVTRRMVMPHVWGENLGDNTQVSASESSFSHRILIQYGYEGIGVGTLRLRLLIADRDFHHQQKETPDLQFSQILGKKCICLQAINSGQFGTPWQMRWTKGAYTPQGVWYWNYGLPEETRRGLGDREDLYSPGYLSVVMQPGDTVTLEARLGLSNESEDVLTQKSFAETVEAQQTRLSHLFGWKQPPTNKLPALKLSKSSATISLHEDVSILEVWRKLLQASDQFVVYRASISGPTVIAGYHWFNDWGRDTLIALPGLALATKRFDLAKGLLDTFGKYCRYGLIPNAFPDVGGEPFYNSIDAALFWIETLGLYLQATEDWEFLTVQYPVVQQIYKAFIGGTRYNIQVDSTDGLVGWDARGVALTWMDAVVDGEVITPRRGKPVEVNALWYSALCWASKWAKRLSQMQIEDSGRFAKQSQRYEEQAQQVQFSLQKFWNPQLGYLYDTIEPDDRRNAQVRPNAVLALSLAHCGFTREQGQKTLRLATQRLLTPYGLRSLDPTDPHYIGKYRGTPQQRDRAYHQGTVWSWLIGPYIRAWKRFYPTESLPFEWQPLLTHFLCEGCLDSVSEIFDGDPPHAPKGAIAQAWSVAEVIRNLQN
ncbi:MAG: amylo-alpha-1,6-glucosidase [Cyanobacteria bacterium P01_A01_bin.84]